MTAFLHFVCQSSADPDAKTQKIGASANVFMFFNKFIYAWFVYSGLVCTGAASGYLQFGFARRTEELSASFYFVDTRWHTYTLNANSSEPQTDK